MRKTLVLITMLCIPALDASAQVVKGLVGRYQMEVPDGDVLELRADGSATLAGEATTWSGRGKTLRVGPDDMDYTLEGGRLVLSMGSVRISWKKLGAKASAPVRPAKDAGANPQDAQARQLLTSSAWCSFTYNKVSGTSTTRKVIFRPDGAMTINGGAETYSSGHGGTFAGQSRSQGAMRWKMENMRLYVDQGGGAGFQDVGLDATRNSNGSIILHADGREYAMCN
jgi:hypothetical protein